MLVSKAGSLPCGGVSEWCSTWVSTGLIANVGHGLKVLQGEKHSSLFFLSIGDEEKQFNTVGSRILFSRFAINGHNDSSDDDDDDGIDSVVPLGVDVIKLYIFALMLFQDKLECLSLESFFWTV
jgi:hypothetical protein